MFTPPIPVILPLLIAALLAVFSRITPRWLSSLLAILTAVTVGFVALTMVVFSRDAAIVVYWFGGWAPQGGPPAGIAFTIDTAGAMLVLLVCLLVTMALIFSYRYFDTVGARYEALMLMFLGAVCGAAQTGDLLNLFFFFELMTVAAVALSAYRPEDPSPFRGALNMAVTNGIGAFLVLCGVGLLYSRAGSMNMAQAGRSLASAAGAAGDPLVLTAFTLLAAGFLVKAAIVPFHFWLADAHATAPAPICVLFSGVMVELGIYALVRVYWAVFSGALAPHENELRNIFAGFAVVSAVAGAVMCYAQRDLKRMLAFSTLSHMGIVLLGVAMLTPEALGGAAIYVMGQSLLTGGLFLAAGIVLHRFGSVDEMALIGRARHVRWTGTLFLVGAAGLAGIPPFGTFWGKVMMNGSAWGLGYGWVAWVSVLAAFGTTAALFRFAARIFFGWGPAAVERDEIVTPLGHGCTPRVMYAAATILILLGLITGLAPRLTGAAESAALFIMDRPGYAQRVLDLLTPYPKSVHDLPAGAMDVVRALLTILAAALLARLSLCSTAFRRVFVHSRAALGGLRGLRALHSGVTPDYVAWLMFGMAALGGAAFFWIR